MKRSFHRIGTVLLSSALLGSHILLPPLPVRAQQTGLLCATPGRDGDVTLTGVINTYYPGVGTAAAGAASIPVGAPTAGPPIQAGDLLLVIQMQGAAINSDNSDAYGNGVGGDSPPNPPASFVPPPPYPPQPTLGASGFTGTPIAGNYEFVVATGPAAGGSIPIRGKGANNGLINTYVSAPFGVQGQQTYQVIRVPQYANATLGTVTAAPWNGSTSTGGVLAFDVSNNLNLAGTADVSGLGFRGGGGRALGGAAGLLNSDFRTLATQDANGSKGEGIAGTPRYIFDATSSTVIDNGVEGYPVGSYGRGAPANAGGGSTDGNPAANNQNSGGGGGANGGFGGIGGNSWSSAIPSGGFGGSSFPATTNRIVMGGGGGAGTTNDATGVPGGGVASSGASGGGLVIIRTDTVNGTGTINANGANGLDVGNDGAGGGGAGGSAIVQSFSSNLAGLTINANGGNGGNAVFADPHGPGGGGGGGTIFASTGSQVNVNGGSNGLTGAPLTPFGALPGGPGLGSGISGSLPGANAGAECRQGPGPQSQNLRLVKRITAITRGGNSVSFNAFVDDPNDPNDTLPGWSQLSPVGVPNISQSEPLQSGDQIEYTVYFLADGTIPVLNTNICDLIPEQTAYVPDTSRIKRAAADPVVGGTYFTPLAPLPSNNSCTDQTNPNGAVVYELGDIPSTTGDNYGFVRFRVRIN